MYNLANNFTKFYFESSLFVILSYCSAPTDSAFLFNIFEVSLVPRILSRICWWKEWVTLPYTPVFRPALGLPKLSFHIKLWGKRRDSNSRSSEPQSDVLDQLHYSHHILEVTTGFEPVNNTFAECPLKPLEYVTILEWKTGFEPATTCLEGRSSGHLSYFRICIVVNVV